MSATMSNGKKIFYGRLVEAEDQERQAEEEKRQNEEVERHLGKAKRQIEEAELRKKIMCENAGKSFPQLVLRPSKNMAPEIPRYQANIKKTVEDAAAITTQNSPRRFHEPMPYAKPLFNEASYQYSIVYYFQPQGPPHAARFGDPRSVPFETGNANSGRKVNSKIYKRREFKPLETKGLLLEKVEKVEEAEEVEAWRSVGQRPRAESAPEGREKVDIAGEANEP